MTPNRENGLKREIGLVGATLLGLGSILGTGIFVSLGIAAGIAGPAVLGALAVAAAVAVCNGLASAQLAANHPVSGGTYEYGYRYLRPSLGFAAGWLFVCAKSASAATAALGFAGYFLHGLGAAPTWLVPTALGTIAVLTLVVRGGMRLSSRVNAVIVTITLSALLAFVLGGLPAVRAERFAMRFEPGPFLQACALMFVAYTGYARIAVLGEEVRDPRRTIPRAIVAVLICSLLIYAATAFVAVGTVGAAGLQPLPGTAAAPLEIAAETFPPGISKWVAVGAMTAMLGVLLNLLLGVSRVLLAMGRRGDMPAGLQRLETAVLCTGILMICLAATGNVRLTWSFSAFSVLSYYVVTNLAALQLASSERLVSPLFCWVGLGACVVLAFSLDPNVWIFGLGTLAVGMLWHLLRRPYRRDPFAEEPAATKA